MGSHSTGRKRKGDKGREPPPDESIKREEAATSKHPGELGQVDKEGFFFLLGVPRFKMINDVGENNRQAGRFLLGRLNGTGGFSDVSQEFGRGREGKIDQELSKRGGGGKILLASAVSALSAPGMIPAAPLLERREEFWKKKKKRASSSTSEKEFAARPSFRGWSILLLHSKKVA